MKKEKLIKKINPLYLKGIAHRGLHNSEFTENGMKAFQNAIDNNVAFEFDVHLTTDGELIVCHDENLKRTTGKEGIIEDMTSTQIREGYRLLDGGVVPTLKEVLALNNEKVPIVIELKVYRKNYKKLSKKLIEQLQDIKDKKNYFLISFDPRSLFPLKKLKIVRGLLVCKEYEWVYRFRHFVESIDIEHVMLKEKKVQKYYKKHFVNTWTVDDETKLNNVKGLTDTITFQFVDYKKVSDALTK